MANPNYAAGDKITIKDGSKFADKDGNAGDIKTGEVVTVSDKQDSFLEIIAGDEYIMAERENGELVALHPNDVA